jgi:hypothetical protein
MEAETMHKQSAIVKSDVVITEVPTSVHNTTNQDKVIFLPARVDFTLDVKENLIKDADMKHSSFVYIM